MSLSENFRIKKQARAMIRDCVENKKSDVGTRTQHSFFERAYQI